MGLAKMCFGGNKNEEDPSIKKNAEIDRILREDKKRQEKEVKILLLGAGESGKSTVLKQMIILNKGGFSQQYRLEWRATIFNNLIEAFNRILGSMESNETPFENPKNADYVKAINDEPEIGVNQTFPADFQETFESLWRDQGVQNAIVRGNEYALHDNLKYFFQDISRLFARDYVPNDQDILHARLRTTGVVETIFDLGNLTYRMFDVGGQRSERKKWIHIFDNVQVVLFLVAINGYDQVLVEDKDGNQMQEALMLFETIANSKWFERSAMIVFLNKIDLFKEKVESGRSPISKQFPDYTGGTNDVIAGRDFFADKFKKLVHRPDKEPYIHFTNATDTDLLRKTMNSVQDMIVQRNLNTLIL